MNQSMNDSTTPPTIPALAALGDQFSLAAANAVLEQRRRPAASWPSILAPALVVLVALMGLSVRLTPSAEAVVVKAADRTAASTTGRFKMSTEITGGAAGTTAPVALSTEGVYDQSTRRLRTSVDLSRVLGAASDGLADFSGTVETIEDGSTVYLRSEVFERLLPEHTAWVKVDVDQLDATSPLSAAATLDGTVTDPSSFLQALRGMGEDTHVVERVDIDGASTLHYRGTVDLDRAAEHLSSEERARLREGFARLGVDQSTVRIPMDVWVDDAGAVRRVRTDVRVDDDPANDPTLRGATITVTVEYGDLDRPEPIVLPDPTVVTDITPMVNRLMTTTLADGAGR